MQDFSSEEPILICVQCSKKYQNSSNPEGHCLFHKAPYDSWNKRIPCCSSNAPCQKGMHRDKHHCNYPYASFMEYAWGITGYTDTTTVWAEVKDKDLTSGDEFICSVSRLLRFKSKGAYIGDQPFLLIRVGRVSFQNKYFFHVFTPTDLLELGKSGKTEIFRTSESQSEYSKAEWIIENGKVQGVKLEAKSATSSNPFLSIIRFNTENFDDDSVKVEKVSEGGFKVKEPAKPYPTLPEKKYLGFTFNENQLKPQEPRNFKTGGELPLKIKLEGIQVNNRSSIGGDSFAMELSFINTQKDDIITICETRIQWKLKGEKEWKKVDNQEVLLGSSWPCKPLQPIHGAFSVFVNDAEKRSREVRMFNKSWIARFKPIRFRFEFEDLSGKKAVQIIEFLNPPPYIRPPSDDVKLFLYVDDPEFQTRDSLNIYDEDLQNGRVFKINSDTFNVETLNKIVFDATSQRQFEPSIQKYTGDNYKWDAFALIDENCNRIYAVKVIIENAFASSIGYYRVPMYSPSEEKAEPKIVDEKLTLPNRDEFKIEIEDFETGDDGLGIEKKPEPVTILSQTQSAQSIAQNSNVEAILPVLISLDSKMDRIATSLEKLVALLSEKK
jgi:hypothetical protein